MSLTLGSAPFGQRPAGAFNDRLRAAGEGILYFEDSPRRVRARLGGETVADTRAAKLLHESGHLPVYYIPREDVRMELLEPSPRRTRCPWKGEASYWSVRVGARVAEHAAWGYPEPIEGAPPLGGHLAFDWEAMDEWLEEDEQVFVHPRDPYHRVDVLPTSRHVRVTVGGAPLAESRAALVLFETGLPPRHYLPAEDVRAELLASSELETGCPYKGTASYWALEQGGEVAWSYATPLAAVAPIAGRIAFFDERVEVELDGVRQQRPQTPWS